MGKYKKMASFQAQRQSKRNQQKNGIFWHRYDGQTRGSPKQTKCYNANFLLLEMFSLASFTNSS